MDSLYQIKVGIIIISVGLLTLIYPLTYNFIAGLLKERFEILKCIKKQKSKFAFGIPEDGRDENQKKEIKDINEAANNILSYYHKIGFVLSLFFITGVFFILDFVIIQFEHEGHPLPFIDSFSFFYVFFVVFFLCSFFLVKREFVEEGEKPTFAVSFVLIYLIMILVSRLPSYYTTQIYCSLLSFSISIIYWLLVWFGLGVYYKPNHQLQTLREKLLDKT